MSSNRQPIATSTPTRPIEEKPDILKEQQGNSDLKRNFHRTTIQKSPSPIKSPKEFKENDSKRKQRGPRRRNQGSDGEKEALRRQQAIEAMKIQESRRLRFVEQAANFPVEPVVEDFDSLSEEKRLIAKQQKHKRIMAFLAEQDARKKKEAEVTEAAKEAPKDEKIVKVSKVKADLKTQIVACKSGHAKEKPKLGFPIYTPKNRCSFKPMPVLPEVEEPKHKRIMTFIAKQAMKTGFPFVPVLPEVEEPKEYFKNKLEVPRKVQRQRVIQYTKDEIRSLNPYGFYFM